MQNHLTTKHLKCCQRRYAPFGIKVSPEPTKHTKSEKQQSMSQTQQPTNAKALHTKQPMSHVTYSVIDLTYNTFFIYIYI